MSEGSNTKDPLDFFDVVEIIGVDDPKLSGVIGQVGYIAGLAYDQPGDPIEAYGVWVYEREEVWSFDRTELKYLGYKDEIAERESQQSCPSIRVDQDGNLL